MSRHSDDVEEFSLEEIIAEVKGVEAADKKRPFAHAPSEAGHAPAVAATAAPAREAPPADPPAKTPVAREVASPPQKPAPVREISPEPKEKTPAAQEAVLFQAPTREAKQEPDIDRDAEAPVREKKRLPWRTERKKIFAAPSEPDTQEFEVTLELPEVAEEAEDEQPETLPQKKLAYDFLNTVFSDAEAAVRQLKKRTASVTARILLLAPLLALAIYMTVSMPFSLPMPFGFYYKNYPFLYLLAYAAIHMVAMVISADVTAAGLMRLVRLRPTLDSLVLFGQLCILAHNISIIIMPQWGGYLPYTCAGIFTLMLAMISKRQRAESLRRTYKASLLGTSPTAIKRVDERGVAMAVKADGGVWIEMEEIASLDSTERLGEIASPIVMVTVAALAAVSSFGQGQGWRFMWCLAALASVSCPSSLLISSSMPCKRIIKKLFASGCGLVNLKRTKSLAKCSAAVLRDRDIFPVGAVKISGMKIAGSEKIENALGYAAAMTQEIGGGLAHAFTELARQQYVPIKRAENLRFYESSGLSAQVDGRNVLLGNASFLMRMGVQVTEGAKLKNTLFMAIDNRFAGIFTIKYGVQSQCDAAFRVFRWARISPLVAIRDINLTQAYVENRFDLRAGATEYPDLHERIRLSEDGMGSGEDTLAFLSRDGMLPYAEAVAAARKLMRAVRLGQFLGMAALAVGIMLMYFLTYNFKVVSATPHNALLYLLLWLVPSWLAGLMTTNI